MKPIFIYKYEAGITDEKANFIEEFEKEGDKWEQMFLSQHGDHTPVINIKKEMEPSMISNNPN